jgi:acyl-CoA synthetase (AMP-forming)/AMP-acid ligase II
MEMHWATVWESIVDVVGDRPAVTNGTVTRSWSDYENRAARIAAAYTAAGLGPDSKIALYLYNGNEYMEAQFGAFKMRGVPVNVNYRYLDNELLYLLDNSDAEALVYHSSLADRVARVVGSLPGIRLLIEVDDTGSSGVSVDGAVAFEDLVAGHDPMPRITREESDIYMLYTGGTTGMPKGVMYATGGITQYFCGLGFPAIGLPVPEAAADIAGVVAGVHERGESAVSLVGAPLMHGTGLWLGALIPHLGGGHVVTLTSRSLDPHEVLGSIAMRRATHMTIVGDSFAKPIIAAIDEAADRGEAYDLSSVKMVLSSGVMWTSEVKEAMLDRLPQVFLYDAMGSSEGSMGSQISMRGMPTATARFSANPTTKLFDENDQEITPGSDKVGRVAAGGLVPLGYFKDPEKSAATFREIDGIRYSFPGDMGQILEDGTLVLLGRGSQVINSGGEKIFPEEVEEAVKRVDGVIDCLVVGVDDEKFGQTVTAVLSGSPEVTAEAVIAGVKDQLAGFKAPRHIVIVDTVPRAPNGKADYKAARELAVAALS